MESVLLQIREELEANQDEAIKESGKRFFKEEITCYGIKTAMVAKIAKTYWKEIKNRDKKDIFWICEELYRSGYLEESFVVSSFAYELRDRYEPEDFIIFTRWIENYISNWASCDGFCNHAIGEFIEQYPVFIRELKNWTQSENRWMRRASAVSLIIPAKQGKFLDDLFEIATLLLTDTDDMVRKGYGWLLKEASRLHQQEVYDFVIRNKDMMPRTSLRYAIELMPAELKAEAMKKEKSRVGEGM